MELDIYDFDKTIVPFDSGSLFCIYCLFHYPWIIIVSPVILAAGFLMILHIINFTNFKRVCFMYLPLIPTDKAVKGFWDKHEKEVNKWFFERKRKCVVISASPDFLIEEIAERLHFDYLICTRHNRKTGIIIGENCRDEEKVNRFKKQFKNAKVIDVYSDSFKHDKPIFSLAAGTCYHIEQNTPKSFDFNKIYGNNGE